MFPNSVKTQKLLLKGLFLQNLSMLLPSFLKECLDETLRQFTPPNSREATAHQLTPLGDAAPALSRMKETHFHQAQTSKVPC